MPTFLRELSDFRMTAFAVGVGLVMCFSLFLVDLVDTEQAKASALLILLLFSLFAVAGLASDFRRLKIHQQEIARQQRDLILQATLFTMADTTDSLRQDLSQLYRDAENGALPDIESLKRLQDLLETHILRLQQLGAMGIYSEPAPLARDTQQELH
jgi:hypothetical protein